MSDLKTILEQTGTTNETELAAYIKQQTEALETAKKERAAAKGQVTKADKKVAALEFDKSVLEDELKVVKGKVSDLEDELRTQAAEITELKEAINQKKKNLLTSDQLRAKARIIMNQQDVSRVFISLTGQCFLDENVIKNAFGSNYRLATLVDEDKVQLSRPSH